MVNYSLWDSETAAIDAISRMADTDRNLEETLDLASPDFRFYELLHHWHAPDTDTGTGTGTNLSHEQATEHRYRRAVAHVTDRLTPQTRQKVDSVYRFQFTDTGTAARLDARVDGAGWVEEPDPADPSSPTADFTVELSRDDFAALVHGELHPMAGMATGRMRLRGSMRRAMVLDRLLKG